MSTGVFPVMFTDCVCCPARTHSVAGASMALPSPLALMVDGRAGGRAGGHTSLPLALCITNLSTLGDSFFVFLFFCPLFLAWFCTFLPLNFQYLNFLAKKRKMKSPSRTIPLHPPVFPAFPPGSDPFRGFNSCKYTEKNAWTFFLGPCEFFSEKT